MTIALTGAVMACGGFSHSAALKQDGTVWTWGTNTSGQLGNGTPGGAWWSTPPGPVTGLTGVISIACAGNHTIALLPDGTVRAWGENTNGELGDGTTTNRLQPVPVSGLGNVKVVNGTAALKKDGTVWEWGFDSCCGQTTPNLVPIQSAGISGAVALSVSFGSVFGTKLEAIKSDGVTWWDWFAGGTPAVQSPVGNLTAVASAPFHTLLLKADGTVVAAGLNNSGQLGNGIQPSGSWDWYSSFLPVVGLANIVAVATGDIHSLALDANGSVWAWGDDARGQLGRGATLTNTVPSVVPGLSNIVQVSAGWGSSLAVDSGGSVWAWGNNYYGQLGDGTNTNRSAPVRLAGVQGVQSVAAGAGAFTATSLALDIHGNVWAWGNNGDGQLGNGTTGGLSTVPVQVPGLANVTAVAGYYHMLAAKQDGTVWGWGPNSNGELGLGTTTPSAVPVQVPGLSGVKSVAATYQRSFAVKTDGSVMAWGWGGLGDGTWRWGAGQLTPIPVPGLTNVVEIAAATYHTLARRTDGSVWGWGDSRVGSALGSSSASLSPTAILTPGAGTMHEISASEGVSALLGADGVLYMGGANSFGQLGDGTFAQHPDFVLAVNTSANGYLNLSTGSTVIVPPALRVPFFVASTGGISGSGAVVKTTTKFNAADLGKSGAVFVTAMVPAGSVGTLQSVATMAQGGGLTQAAASTSSYIQVQLTATGWQQVVNGQLIPYASGVLGDLLAAQTILNGTDTTNLQGSQFCLGYGASAAAMIATGQMRVVATIPTDPSSTSTATVSCIVDTSGTSTLTVSSAGSGTGTVTSSPAGINCGATCSASFTGGTSVTLTAAPAAGSTFAGWSGACTGTSTCTVTMDAAKSVAANFAFSVPICTLTAIPTSIVAGNSSTLTASCSPAATSYVWTGGTCAGASAASCTVTPTATTTYTVAGINSAGTGGSASAAVTVTSGPAATLSLENPQAGSFQSGIGLVSGWSCQGPNVSVSVDGGAQIPLVYGSSRADTASACGAFGTNTGYGMLANFNLLGNGTHIAQVFVNGVPQGVPTQFTVTVPSGQFLTGVSSQVDVPNFPSANRTTTLMWQQSQQNFVIRSVTPASTPVCALTATPASIASGGNSTLTASCSPTATSYVWTGGTCAGASAASCTVTPTATTTYTVAGVNSAGTGAAASATVTVTLTPGPTPTLSLENPQPGSFQSGIGLVSGWSCQGPVGVSIDGGAQIPLVYGSSRADTASVCGANTNTGFGMLANYNLLGNGTHTAQLHVNGVPQGVPTQFIVIVPSGQFLTGVSSQVDVPDFPSVNRTTTLMWQESAQNFVIKSVIP